MKIVCLSLFLGLFILGISFFMGLVMVHILNKRLQKIEIQENFSSKKKKKKKKKNSQVKLAVNIPINKIVEDKAKAQAKKILDKEYGVDINNLDKDDRLKHYKNHYRSFEDKEKKRNHLPFEVRGYNIGDYG